MTFGFSRVTADEIAAGLGISKATLYKHFGSKKEILREVVAMARAEILGIVESIIADESAGFLDKIMRLMLQMGEWFSQVGRVFAQDVRRSAPRIWEEIEVFRKQKILLNFRILLEAGVREGVIRPDVDLELIVQIYYVLIQEFVPPDRLFNSRHSVISILETLFKVFFEGVLTGQARENLAGRQAGFDLMNKEAFR